MSNIVLFYEEKNSLKETNMRSRFPVAVHLFFVQNDRLLVLRRFNTGWQDGNYSVPAGHVDAGETVSHAAGREAYEEIGVRVDPADLAVVHVMNRKSEDERIDFFLTVAKWTGDITNREPDKCDDLRWCLRTSPPDNLIPYVRRAFEHYSHGVFYSEFGW